MDKLVRPVTVTVASDGSDAKSSTIECTNINFIAFSYDLSTILTSSATANIQISLSPYIGQDPTENEWFTVPNNRLTAWQAGSSGAASRRGFISLLRPMPIHKCRLVLDGTFTTASRGTTFEAYFKGILR